MMILIDGLQREYFEWLQKLVCGERYSPAISFRKLLMHLHDAEFKYIMRRDRNRASDGVDLRYRYAIEMKLHDPYDITDILDGPCSVLEMMVALALKCEDTMDDLDYGDRTRQWFWGMIVNLGLGGMTDENYDEKEVTDILDRFHHRRYEPDGKGGLFRIRGCTEDLRKVEIWRQLLWFMDSIV